MSRWFEESEESGRLLAQEKSILAAAELVSEALDRRGVTRRELADRLGVPRSEVTQRLRGTRNLTVRSLADMLHALDFDLDFRIRDRQDGHSELLRDSAQT